jgi:hypothetical protein
MNLSSSATLSVRKIFRLSALPEAHTSRRIGMKAAIPSKAVSRSDSASKI